MLRMSRVVPGPLEFDEIDGNGDGVITREAPPSTPRRPSSLNLFSLTLVGREEYEAATGSLRGSELKAEARSRGTAQAEARSRGAPQGSAPSATSLLLGAVRRMKDTSSTAAGTGVAPIRAASEVIKLARQGEAAHAEMRSTTTGVDSYTASQEEKADSQAGR